MCSLAGLLLEAGHQVTGTDEKLYPPMSDQLSLLGIKPFEGYSASNIESARPDLVIIGNVIRRENPEAQEALRLDVPIRSMPQAVEELILKDRSPVVIAGTHGKTTASSILAWLMESAGDAPGFLIGGVPLNFGRSYSRGLGPFFIVEGDEYDSAFFDKNPKFLHYHPQALILTSIEFDHADIYRDIDHLTSSFKRLVKLLPPEGIVIACADDARVRSITTSVPCRVVTYGLSDDAYWRPIDIQVSESGTSFSFPGQTQRFTLPLWGRHNLTNAAAALALLIESGRPPSKLASGLTSFKGVRRRQELISDNKGVTIIDDFAHHPTAVVQTIEAMRARFPGRRLWAIFEPRSNTSRRNVFQREFAKALSRADRAIIAGVHRANAIPQAQRLSPDRIADALMRRGIDAHHISSTEHIVEFVMRGVDSGDVILIMSNGDFDQLPNKLVDGLKKRHIVARGGQKPSIKVPG